MKVFRFLSFWHKSPEMEVYLHAAITFIRQKKLDVVILLLIGFYNRCFDLSYPHAVVFDEVHYGSICSLYHEQQFHYDERPPLFRLLLCHFLPQEFLQHSVWTHVGKEFNSDPCFARFVSAILGVILIALVYYFTLVLKYSHITAFIAAFFVTFDNGLVVQSRLMVADSFNHALILSALCCVLHRSNTVLIISHIFVGLAISTDSSSISMFILIVCLSTKRSWVIFTNNEIPLAHAMLQGCLYIVSSLLVPLLVYLSVIIIHINCVPFSGPHASLMSSAFQATLRGGLATGDNIVSYGSYIRLRATGDIPPFGSCYLHSFPQTYPFRYDDGRGSSGQQVVSCCHQSGKESIWKVLHPTHLYDGEPVRHDDIIHLVHVGTNRPLNTHDVASPLSQYRQEVSCYIDYNISAPAHFEWKVDVKNGDSYDSVWYNLHSHVWLLHVDSSAFLDASGSTLPEWGRSCVEVAGDSLDNLESNIKVWNAETVPATPNEAQTHKHLTAFEMALEYILRGWLMTEKSKAGHRFASNLHEWPFAWSNIAYWHNATSNAQLHFTGNVASWNGGLLITLLLVSYFLYVMFCEKLKKRCITRVRMQQLQFTLCTLGGAWFLHMSYFSFNDISPLFSYQYLPAVVYLHVLQSCAIEVLCNHCGVIAIPCTVLYLLLVLMCYNMLRPLTFAFPNLTKSDLGSTNLCSSWELLTP